MKKLLAIIGLFSLLPFASFAQVLDGAFAHEHVAKREPIKLQYIRETDGMYAKRVLRFIDLDEKINHPLYFPIRPIDYPDTNKNGIAFQPNRKRVNLIELIYAEGLKRADDYNLTAFEFNPSDWTSWWAKEIEPNLLDSVLFFTAYEDYVDLNGITKTREKRVKINIMDVKSFIFWEEWVFDKQRSVMDVRIKAMAPVANAKYSVDKLQPDGTIIGMEREQIARLFWIPFNDFRPLFASYEVFNTQNDAERRTFDDIFLKRRFSSYVIAESNNYDNRLIGDYLLGIDALREGEYIQEKIFQFEHDQWEY